MVRGMAWGSWVGVVSRAAPTSIYPIYPLPLSLALPLPLPLPLPLALPLSLALPLASDCPVTMVLVRSVELLVRSVVSTRPTGKYTL